MIKLFFAFMLTIGVLMAVPNSAEAQDMEQLKKLLETMDLPEEETTETTEEELMPSYEDYMKQYYASQEAAHPGASEGWPADAFQNWGITMRQPAGTEARHNDDGGYSLEVYLKCQNMDAVVQDLVRQMEAATNKKAEANKNEYTYDAKGNQYTSTSYQIYMEGKRFDWNITVRQEDGYVVLWISNSAQ